jgi:hypothetical protein
MRKCLIFICLAASFFVCIRQQPFAEKYDQVGWVIDGDTIVLADGRKVRYIGINAPEIEHDDQKAEPFGNEAKSFNQGLVYRKNIRLEFDRERFHLPACPLAKAISVRNQVLFTTKWDAFWRGYAPAKKCIKEVLGSEAQ